MIEPFEWARPAWLLALAAGLVFLWVWWRRHAGRGLWHRLVDGELLEHLAGQAPASSGRLGLGIAIAVLVLACCALAGPVWHAQPASSQQLPSARIVVLDLSPSMDAIDVAPSRLARARDATAALLREAAGAQLGVVVFGADAFSIAPMTNDPATLVHLLAGAGSGTVPRAGSRPDLGLEMARALLKQAGVSRGEVILVGDSAGDSRTLDAARGLLRAGFPVSVLAVGTVQGGPIPRPGGVFARTEAGEILIARAELAALEEVAQSGGGRFAVFRAAGQLPQFTLEDKVEPFKVPRRAPEEPHDGGAWLALAALPFAALLFRRGWLTAVAAFALLPALAPPQAHAFDWEGVWRRADQQAAAAFARGKPSDTARVLGRLDRDSPWHAMLLYRSGNFTEAAAQFATGDTAVAHYNRGNALALDGELEAALEAYDAALARNPAMQDAHFNRALVRKALAERSMQPQEGADGQSKRQQKASPSAARSRGQGGGRAESSDPSGRRSQVEEFAMPKQAPARDAGDQGKAQDASQAASQMDAAERERLEALVSKVRDDPGSLLANRFAQQLRSRGTPPPDTGARW